MIFSSSPYLETFKKFTPPPSVDLRSKPKSTFLPKVGKDEYLVRARIQEGGQGDTPPHEYCKENIIDLLYRYKNFRYCAL